MKNFFLLVTISLICAGTAAAQDQSTAAQSVESKTVRVDGLVVERKKYSFTILRDNIKYSVKIADSAVVGLKMNKPWIDWEKKQVVVDAIEYKPNSEAVDLRGESVKRVSLPLPAESLFLISRLGDKSKVKQFKKTTVKRLNFYLITPEDPGQHFPTNEEPFLSGALSVKENKTHIDVENQSLEVKLGFRYATMNGFSISQLEPNKTQVFLTGVWADGEQEIMASRILFQPVLETSAVIESSPVETSSAATTPGNSIK